MGSSLIGKSENAAPILGRRGGGWQGTQACKVSYSSKNTARGIAQNLVCHPVISVFIAAAECTLYPPLLETNAGDKYGLGQGWM